MRSINKWLGSILRQSNNLADRVQVEKRLTFATL